MNKRREEEGREGRREVGNTVQKTQNIEGNVLSQSHKCSYPLCNHTCCAIKLFSPCLSDFSLGIHLFLINYVCFSNSPVPCFGTQQS